MLLWIQNFNIKENRMMEFQKFIRENENILAKHAPKGWKYMGTYFYALMLGLYTGASLWECSVYADFDTWRNHDDPIWLKLAKQAMDFQIPGAPAMILREVGDSKVIEPEKKP